MRSFLIVGFLAAVASAGVLPGYKYGPGVSGIREETLPAAASYSGSYVSQGSNSYRPIVPLATGISYVSNGNYKQSFPATTTYNIGLDSLDSVPQTVHYTKQFYHFDAPEEIQLESKVTKQLSNTLKKNLQVVFIKAPENNAAVNAALQLAKQAIEQKTAIYVLSKQNDPTHFVGQLQQIQENVQSAPEVRFVKYRTPEDVQRAKASIQAQYDNTEGISENYNTRFAPVLNYASAAKPAQVIFGGLGSKTVFTNDFGNNYKFGTTFFKPASNFTAPKPAEASNTIKESSASSSKSESNAFVSGSNASESASTQLIEDSSSTSAAAGSFISTDSYLPPLPLKK